MAYKMRHCSFDFYTIIKFLMMCCLFLFLIAFNTPVKAVEGVTGIEQYQIDKNHTNIIWYISHMGFSRTIGKFQDFEGIVTLNYDDPTKSEISITIDTKSISEESHFRPPSSSIHIRKYFPESVKSVMSAITQSAVCHHVKISMTILPHENRKGKFLQSGVSDFCLIISLIITLIC